MKVHHIGYLVSDMKDALKEFRRLGYEVRQETMYDPLRNINICFVENGSTLVELIEPGKDCALFTKLHRKIGNAPYHIGYITDIGRGGLERKLEELQTNGYILVQPPETAIALGSMKAAFLMNTDAGLIEVIGD